MKYDVWCDECGGYIALGLTKAKADALSRRHLQEEDHATWIDPS